MNQDQATTLIIGTFVLLIGSSLWLNIWCYSISIYSVLEGKEMNPIAERLAELRHKVTYDAFDNETDVQDRIVGEMADGHNEINRLELEVARLKEGKFTEEEFQNICHNFSADDLCRFRKGCEDTQRKLFDLKTYQECGGKGYFIERYVGSMWCTSCSGTGQVMKE